MSASILRVRHPFPVLVFLVLLLLSAAPLSALPEQEQAPAVRVAIVLGNAPAGTDEPTTAQTARCLKAYELYKSGEVNKLLVTGGFTRDHISEARMMKIALVTFGVPPDDILEDEFASSTIENGLFASKMFEERGWAKTGILVSQQYHLPRSQGIFQKQGFTLKDAAAADAASLESVLPLLDMKADQVVKAQPTDLIVVYEPYRSTEPMHWPTMDLAKRLRLAAALYHRKAAPGIVLYNDHYTRGAVNLAQMMKIALVSLGVPASSLTVVARGEHRFFGSLAKAYAERSAIVLTSPAAKTAPAGFGGMRPPAATPPGASAPPTAGAPPAAGAPAGAPPAGAKPPAMMTPEQAAPKWTWVYVQ